MAYQQVLTQADEFQKILMGGGGSTGVLHQYLVLLISVASGFHLVGSMTDQNWIWVTWDWRMGSQFTMRKHIRCTEKCWLTHTAIFSWEIQSLFTGRVVKKSHLSQFNRLKYCSKPCPSTDTISYTPEIFFFHPTYFNK